MDKDSFCTQITAHRDGMYRLALSICKNTAEAEDAVADAVLTAWAKLPALKNEASFKPWVFKILSKRGKGGGIG